jgi:hypothetical protein
VNGRRAMTLAAGRRDSRVGSISRAGKQPVERRKNAVLASGDMLTIDLLQTQYVSLQTLECGTQDLRAHIERHTIG